MSARRAFPVGGGLARRRRHRVTERLLHAAVIAWIPVERDASAPRDGTGGHRLCDRTHARVAHFVAVEIEPFELLESAAAEHCTE